MFIPLGEGSLEDIGEKTSPRLRTDPVEDHTFMTFGGKNRKKEIGRVDDRTKSTLESLHARFEIGNKSKTKLNKYCSLKNIQKHFKADKVGAKSTKTATSSKVTAQNYLKKVHNRSRKPNNGIFQKYQINL